MRNCPTPTQPLLAVTRQVSMDLGKCVYADAMHTIISTKLRLSEARLSPDWLKNTSRQAMDLLRCCYVARCV